MLYFRNELYDSTVEFLVALGERLSLVFFDEQGKAVLVFLSQSMIWVLTAVLFLLSVIGKGWVFRFVMSTHSVPYHTQRGWDEFTLLGVDSSSFLVQCSWYRKRFSLLGWGTVQSCLFRRNNAERVLCWYGEQFSLVFLDVTIQSSLLGWGTVLSCLFRYNNKELSIGMGNGSVLSFSIWQCRVLCWGVCGKARV